MFYSGSPLLEKSARLKQAKEEAEKEIAAYRAKLEAEFQKKVSDVSIFFDKYNSYTTALSYSMIQILQLTCMLSFEYRVVVILELMSSDLTKKLKKKSIT